MTFTYTDPVVSGASTVKSFHLVKGSFNQVRAITGVSNATPIVVTTGSNHNLNNGDTVNITGVFGTSTLTVSGASNTNPIQVTTTVAHKLVNGNTVTISGVTGNTNTNGVYIITYISPTVFSLNGRAGNAAYISGGTIVAPYDIVNGTGYVITYISPTTFSLNGSTGKGAYATGGSVLKPATQYWTDCDIPLTALGQTWIPIGIIVGDLTYQDTTATGTTVVIQNADLAMSGLIYNPLQVKNVPMDIYEAWMDPSVTTASVTGGLGVDVKTLFSGIISSSVVSRQGDIAIATFQLAPPIDVNAVMLPRRLLTTTCTVLFKGPACQYSGGDESCLRTLVACTAKGNQTNYGGFPMVHS